MARIQRQLSQLNFIEDPEKHKNYNQTHRTSEIRSRPKFSSPTAVVEEDLEHHRELEEPHRTLALKGVEVDTRPERQDGAVGGHPSTGATPQPLQLLDLSSPSAATAAEGRTSQIQPATIHKTRSKPGILEDKGHEQHHLKDNEALARTPVQKLLNLPMEPERRTIGARRSWSIIPLRRCRQRQEKQAAKD
jgi:hypothetical protein